MYNLISGFFIMSSTTTTTKNSPSATMHQTRQLLQSPLKMKQQQQIQQQQQQKLQEVEHYSDDPDKLLSEWLGELENLIGVSFLDTFLFFFSNILYPAFIFVRVVSFLQPVLDVLVPFSLSK